MKSIQTLQILTPVRFSGREYTARKKFYQYKIGGHKKQRYMKHCSHDDSGRSDWFI